MKSRVLLPLAVLDDPSTASVDRILARRFWETSVPSGVASVVSLEERRERRIADAAELTPVPCCAAHPADR